MSFITVNISQGSFAENLSWKSIFDQALRCRHTVLWFLFLLQKSFEHSQNQMKSCFISVNRLVLPVDAFFTFCHFFLFSVNVHKTVNQLEYITHIFVGQFFFFF